MQARKGTGATGLEPATSGVTGRRSNQLSYAPEGIGRACGAARIANLPGGRGPRGQGIPAPGAHPGRIVKGMLAGAETAPAASFTLITTR
jgi:hypothetical protein